jgi:hypothetical protein
MKSISSQHISSHATQLSSSQLFSANLSSPRLFSTHLNASHLLSAHLSTSHLNSSQLTSTHLNSSQLISSLVFPSQLISTLWLLFVRNAEMPYLNFLWLTIYDSPDDPPSILSWLVVDLPLRKILVSWDDVPNIWKVIKFMFQTTNQ